MSIKKRVMEIVSLILVFAFVFEYYLAVPAHALADKLRYDEALNTQIEDSGFSKNTELEYSPLVGEELSGRSESEKTFRRADGAYEKVVYPYPVHFKENGEWVDIDNTLKAITDKSGKILGYQTTAGKHNVQFGLNLQSDKLVKYSIGENKYISWSFKDLESSDITVLQNSSKEELESGKDRDMALRFPSTLYSEILYEDAESGTSVKYTLNSYKLSEYITLSEKPTQKVAYTIEFDCVGLSPVEENGSVKFVDENDAVQFVMSTPIMEDTTGEQSEEFSTSLVRKETSTRAEVSEENNTEAIVPEEPEGQAQMEADPDNSASEENELSTGEEEQQSETVAEQIIVDGADAESESEITEATEPEAVETTEPEAVETTEPEAVETTAPEDITTNELETDESADKTIGGTFVYTIEPSMEWLNSADRSYPVVIDPDIKLNFRDNVQDTYISNNDKTTNYGARDRIKIGADSNYRSLIRIEELPALNAGDVIIEATLNLSRYNSNSSNGKEIDLHVVKTAWDQTTVTWSNFYANSNPADFSRVESMVASENQDEFNIFDITNLVKRWYDGTQANYGVLLKLPSDSQAWYMEYRSSDYSAAYETHPYFSIVYINSTGLEDRFTYHSQSAGRAGTSAVNDYSGNLTVSHSDASITNGTMPVNVSHVFNTNDKDTDIGYGKGWRLNYSQSIKKVSLTDRTKTATYYQLIDGDGTRHYYRADGTSTVNYVNELDKDTKLTVSTSNKKITVTDKGGNKLIFDCDTAMNNGRLSSIEDANGNKTIIAYTTTTITNLRIASVAEKSAMNSSNGQSLTFTYANNLLSAITAPDGLNVNFGYSSGRLATITYKDGLSSTYTYNGNGCITKITNIDGYNLNFEYNSKKPYRVTKVTEKAGTVAGNYISYDYGWNTTTISDNQGRKVVYQFNNSGQAVSVRDVDGSAVYAAYNTADQTVTQLSAVSKLQKTNFNLLKNHGFESSSNAAWVRSNSTYITYSSTYQREGKYSLKLVSSETKSVHATQTVAVTPGKTYTFSAYFSGVNGGWIQIINPNTSRTLASNTNVQTSGTVGTTWTREAVSCTIPSDVTSVIVKLAQPRTSIGTVYVDSAQFEESPSPSRYNMIENGDFSDGMTAWTTNSNITSSDGIVTDSHSSRPTSFSNKVYNITGAFDKTKYIAQTIEVNGKQNDTYSFGAWMRSDSVPQRTETYNDRTYGIKRITIEFLNGSSTVNVVPVYFGADTEDWQYVCGSAVAAGAYTKIRLSLNYHYTRNECYYDGVQLYKEEFSQGYTYDSKGNLTNYTSLIGQQDKFEYDSNNNLIKSTDARGKATTYTYDGKHNLLTTTTPTGVVTTNTYNTAGQVTETKVGNSTSYIRTTSAYDNTSGLLSSVTDALGNSVLTEYDSATRLVSEVTNANNASTQYDYDTMNRLDSVSASGSNVSYSYTQDKLTEVNVNDTVRYGMTYDGYGRRLTVTAGDTTLSTNTYGGASGQLTQTAYGNGTTVTYVYDILDRPIEVKYNGTSAYKYTYDNEGNLYSAKNVALNQTAFFEYDHAGRCVKSVLKNSSGTVLASYAYNYDANNNLSKLYATTNGSSWATTYAYDNDNRPLSATLANGKVVSNTYDAIGRISNKKIGSYTTTLSYLAGINGSQTERLASYKNGSDNAYQYTYDANGNITHIQQGSNHVYYQYDALNQLVREDNSVSNKSITYTYDANGNLLQKSEHAYVANGGELGEATNTILYGYEAEHQNWADQLTSYNGEAIRYDGIGNPTTYRGYTMSWLGRRLTSASGNGNTLSYTYDENGLRAQKTVNGTATQYRYHGSALISQVKGSDKLLFSYDVNGNVVSVNYNGTYYYYVRNGQNDIIRLIDGNNNSVVEYTYDSWGKPISTTGTLASTLGAQNPFRYRGYVYDSETGFYYLQSRYYDPEVGRFLNVDSYISTGQGVLGTNMYAYCLNNPVNFIDECGTACSCISNRVNGKHICNDPNNQHIIYTDKYRSNENNKSLSSGSGLPDGGFANLTVYYSIYVDQKETVYNKIQKVKYSIDSKDFESVDILIASGDFRYSNEFTCKENEIILKWDFANEKWISAANITINFKNGESIRIDVPISGMSIGEILGGRYGEK